MTNNFTRAKFPKKTFFDYAIDFLNGFAEGLLDFKTASPASSVQGAMSSEIGSRFGGKINNFFNCKNKGKSR